LLVIATFRSGETEFHLLFSEQVAGAGAGQLPASAAAVNNLETDGSERLVRLTGGGGGQCIGQTIVPRCRYVGGESDRWWAVNGPTYALDFHHMRRGCLLHLSALASIGG